MTEQTTARVESVRGKNLLKLVGSVLVVGIVLFFLGRVLYSNWAQIRAYQWQFNLPFLSLSFVALVGSYMMDIGVWRQAIVRMGEKITYPQALRLYFTAGLGKYIPGTVWQFVGWFYLAQREGVSGLAAGTSLVLTQALSAMAGAMLALGAFAASGSKDALGQLVPLVMIIPIALIVLQPRLIEAVLNLGLTKIGRQPVHFNLTRADLAILFVLYLCSYSLWGLALFLFANALTPLDWVSFAPFLGVFPASYALGLVAPFAPAGLGVREAALTYFLSFFVSLPIATVIALLTRPWMIVVELVGALWALISYARDRHKGDV
jgi:hypothetical protein